MLNAILYRIRWFASLIRTPSPIKSVRWKTKGCLCAQTFILIDHNNGITQILTEQGNFKISVNTDKNEY